MNVNQNDIRSDLPDILERDHDIRFTVQKTQDLVTSRNHDLTDAPAAGIKLQITHPAQLLTVPDIDDILAFQLRKKHGISPVFLFLQNMRFFDFIERFLPLSVCGVEKYARRPGNIFPGQVHTTTIRSGKQTAHRAETREIWHRAKLKSAG